MANESFNSNVEAVTHDSDPKKLQFVTISQDPGRLFQRGETKLNPQGTDVDLVRASAFGDTVVPAVTLVKLGDLTGGDDNLIRVTLTPPNPTIGSITGGRQILSSLDEFGNSLFVGDMTYVFLQSIAAGLGLSGASSCTMNTGLNLAAPGMIGKRFTDVQLDNITDGSGSVPWATSPIALNQATSLFTWILHHTDDNSNAALISMDLTDNNHAAINGITSSDYIIRPGDELWLQVNLVALDTTPVTVDIPIDAASLLAGANPGALNLTSGTAGRYGTALLAPYAGYHVVEVILVIGPDGGAAQYGPVRMVAPSGLTCYFESSDGDGSPAQSIDLRPTVSSYQWPTPPGPAGRTVTADSAIKVDFNLRPNISTPAIYAALLVTEPYEIRTRNQVAFRFSCVPPFSERPDDYTTPQFAVWLFGSQGEVEGKTLWTRIPFNVVGVNGLVQHAIAQNVDAYPFYDFLPDFWGGTTIIFDNQEYATPWNYVRFLILPVEENDVSEYVLSITANAREL